MKSGFLPESQADRVRFEKEVTTAFDADLTDLRQFLNLPVEPLDHIELFREYYRGLNKSAQELDINYEEPFSVISRDILPMIRDVQVFARTVFSTMFLYFMIFRRAI